MLWVQRDLSAIVKAIFDNWDARKQDLLHQYLYAMDAIHTPTEVCQTIERGEHSRRSWSLALADSAVTGLPTKYVILPNTGNESRDVMFNLYNKTGTYPGVQLPDQKVLDLGVELHGLEQFVREDLVPHLRVSGDVKA